MTQPTRTGTCLEGQLEGSSVAALIREISRRGATGQLILTHASVERRLHFEEGRVIFASSTDPNDRIGEHLLRQGKVTLSQLERALAEQLPGKRLGAIMVETGALDAEDLSVAIRGQIRSVVFAVLDWVDGAYRFEEGPLPTREDITLEESTARLLYDGSRNVRALRTIEAGVGTARTGYRLSGDGRARAANLDLSPVGLAVVERLAQEPASVEVLCRVLSFSNFDVLRTLWALRLLDVVESMPLRTRAPGEEGSLAEESLPELLLRFEADGRTGVLYLDRGPAERSILFAAGRCVFATSNDPDDGLVNFLFRRGVISLRDRQETVRRLLTNKRVGTILREIGAIDEEDLQEMVRQQVSEIVYDTMGWIEGEFVFVDGPLPQAEEITLNTSAAALVAEGIRRVRSWTRLVQGCGGVDNPLCLSPGYLEVLDAIGADVAEWEVVNALKAPQTPRRACHLTELNDLRVVQILWTLRLLGAIDNSPVTVDETLDAEPCEEHDSEVDEPGAPAAALPDEEPQPVAPRALLSDPEPAPEEPEPAHDVPMVAVDVDRPLGPTEMQPASDVPEAAADPAEQVEETLRSFVEEQPLEDETTESIEEEEVEPVGLSLCEVEPTDADSAGESRSFDDGLHGPGDWQPLPNTDGMIDRFNAMHRVIFRVVRTEVGAGATNFVRSCCETIAADDTDPVADVRLHADGSWDVDDLRRVIVERRLEDPWPAYQRLLEVEFERLEPHLDPASAGQLKGKILEIE